MNRDSAVIMPKSPLASDEMPKDSRELCLEGKKLGNDALQRGDFHDALRFYGYSLELQDRFDDDDLKSILHSNRAQVRI